jgi:CHAD domain-containing protein
MTARAEAWRTPVEVFARESLNRLLDVVGSELERCAAEPGVDPVHDLRVAIRRFSQALRIFSSLYPARVVKKTRKRLSVVLDAAAAVRDLDVGIERLKEEGLAEDSAVIASMHEERRLKAYKLLGEIYLLRAEGPLNGWRTKLRLNA